MQKVRTRCVNVRVTDEEFERLKTACAQRGDRCLSDFARQVMLEGAAPREISADRLQSFERRLAVLEDSISRLSNAFACPAVESLSKSKS